MLSKHYCSGCYSWDFKLLACLIFNLQFSTNEIIVYDINRIISIVFLFLIFRHSCWLNTTDGVIWAFAGPVILVIAVSIDLQK